LNTGVHIVGHSILTTQSLGKIIFRWNCYPTWKGIYLFFFACSSLTKLKLRPLDLLPVAIEGNQRSTTVGLLLPDVTVLSKDLSSISFLYTNCIGLVIYIYMYMLQSTGWPRTPLSWHYCCYYYCACWFALAHRFFTTRPNNTNNYYYPNGELLCVSTVDHHLRDGSDKCHRARL
jgi:hypothetical protein